MKTVEYKFENIQREKNSSYIFQMTSGRELSKAYHFHDFFEIVFVISGWCLHFINGREYKMISGEFVFLRPGDCHLFIEQGKNTNLFALSIEKTEFFKFAAAYGNEFEKNLFSTEHPEIFEYGAELSVIYDRCSFCMSSENREYEYKFLLCMLIKCFTEATQKRYDELPRDLIKVIREIQCPENLQVGIPAMIKISNYSRTQLARLMKKYMHVTLHEYIFNLRLNTAYNYIIFSSEGLEEISEKIGYSSFSHFNRIFKHTFGITPAALRKKRHIRTV